MTRKTSETDTDLKVRPARSEDREFIFSLASRLTEFGPPPWHDPARMTSTDREILDAALSAQTQGTTILVAEAGNGALLGFIHLNTEIDYYTREENGHISDVAVAAAGEGRGVGRALMAAGEEWGRARGHALLTLNVFVKNIRARRLYEKLGYAEDMMKYVKELRRQSDDEGGA